MLRIDEVPLVVDSSHYVCPYCLSGKMHTMSFPSTHVKATIPFHRIHSDVLGLSLCKSLDGYRFVVTFIDECTGFTWMFPIFNKSKVFTMFMRFSAFVQTQFSALLSVCKVMGYKGIL